MSAWEEFKDSVYTAGKDISQKAKDVSEVARLKLDIRSKQDFAEKQYAILGTAYYAGHKDEENLSEADAEQFRVITEALEEITRMKQEICRLQGAVECPKCGCKMQADAVFCSSCGAKLDDIFEED